MVSFSTLSLREKVPWAPAGRKQFCTLSWPRLATMTLDDRELSGMRITGAPASISSRTLDARWGCSRTCRERQEKESREDKVRVKRQSRGKCRRKFYLDNKQLKNIILTSKILLNKIHCVRPAWMLSESNTHTAIHRNDIGATWSYLSYKMRLSHDRDPANSTHSLALHCGPLPAKDILQLGEMLDECHHLSLEALGVDVLHWGHLQGHLDVTFSLQVRIRLPVSEWTKIQRWLKKKDQFLHILLLQYHAE